MKSKLALILAVVSMAIAVTAGSQSSQDVLAFPDRLHPDLPSGIFVARIYYDHIEDLRSLETYDIWEYNNIEQQYLLVSVDSRDYQNLEDQGYSLQIDRQLTALLSSKTSPFSAGYRTVEEIYAELEEINARHPRLTELVAYGRSSCQTNGECTTPGGESLAGYDLVAMRISNEDIAGISSANSSKVTRGTKPVFFLLANIHAREIATTEIAMRFIEHLLLYYDLEADITWLVDWHELWIVPIANPDGHWLVELGADPAYAQGAFYQRKNANRDSNNDGASDCSVWPPTTSAQYGVDLNRNHSFAWGGGGSSDDPCSQTFRGPGPASEAEVSALQTLVKSLIPDQRGENLDDPAPKNTTGLLITLHSFGDMILWPWGSTNEDAPNRDGLRAIGDKLAVFNKYVSCQASTCLYFASGTTDDWAYGELGIPAFTFEIGDWFMPDYSEIGEKLWPSNLPPLLFAAQIARTPYETILGPNVNAISTFLDKEQEALVITAIIDDSDHGGNYVASASYVIDSPPWVESADVRAMSATDGRFDQQVESVSAIVPLADFTPGNHILYVSAQDENGYRGLASSVFIDIEEIRSPSTYIPLTVYAP